MQKANYMLAIEVLLNACVKRSACRLAEWVAFLHEGVIATVVMCHICNPAYTVLLEYIKHSKDRLITIAIVNLVNLVKYILKLCI